MHHGLPDTIRALTRGRWGAIFVAPHALVTRYAYDDLGHRIQSTDAYDKVSYANFDAYGNVTDTTAYGVHTTSNYDALRRKTCEQNALGVTLHWTVDAFGPPTTTPTWQGASRAVSMIR